MLNQDRYKTAEERVKAFDNFCSKRRCSTCKIRNNNPTSYCAFLWLALEADEEKPEQCFYCGGECSLEKDNGDHLGNHEYWIECSGQGCYYRSGNAQSAEDAIAAHNRVARAVRAAKEGEVK